MTKDSRFSRANQWPSIKPLRPWIKREGLANQYTRFLSLLRHEQSRSRFHLPFPLPQRHISKKQRRRVAISRLCPAAPRRMESLDKTCAPLACKLAEPRNLVPAQQYEDARHQMQLAMEQVPMTEKTDYVAAKLAVPRLVEAESDPVQFFVNERLDAASAARRLAGYWKLRVSLFGQEAAFLPLNQTGEGALSRADISLLSSGFLSLLANTDSGHAVISYDGTRLTKSPKDGQLRVAFYFFQLAAENPNSQTDGLVLLHLMDTSCHTKRQCLDAVLNVLPIRIREVHVTTSTNVRGSDIAITGVVEKLFGKSALGRVLSYGNAAAESLAQQLSDHGLYWHNIPTAIGGGWGYEKFVDWQDLRTRYEWDLPPGANNKDVRHSNFDFSRIKSPMELTVAERSERKRRMVVLQSRRKRERERIEIQVLQEKRDEYVSNNKALLHDNQRLEDLTAEASLKIAGVNRGYSVANVTPDQRAKPMTESATFWQRPRINEAEPLWHVTGPQYRLAVPTSLYSPMTLRVLPTAASLPSPSPHELQSILQEIRSHSHAIEEMRLRLALEERRLQVRRFMEQNPAFGNTPSSPFQPPPP
jgi:hypothetical protein